MPISAARQPGQLPGWEPAGHGTWLWKGGGSHIAELNAATPVSFLSKHRILHFRHCQILSISKLEKKGLWNTENKEFIALVASVSYRSSCLDLI